MNLIQTLEKEQAAKLLELNEVSDVLFTDFLVQF